MNRLTKRIVFGVLLALLFATGPATLSAEDTTGVEDTVYDVNYQPWVGKEAPGFTLAGVGGKKLSLSDLRGKFVVIHFGASW